MLRTQQREMMSLTSWRRRGSAYNNRCPEIMSDVKCTANVLDEESMSD